MSVVYSIFLRAGPDGQSVSVPATEPRVIDVILEDDRRTVAVPLGTLDASGHRLVHGRAREREG